MSLPSQYGGQRHNPSKAPSGHHLPSINPGQNDPSYPISNGNNNNKRAYNAAGVWSPSSPEGVATQFSRSTSAGLHGRVDWKAKYLK